MKNIKDKMKLYAVSDRSWVGHLTFLQQVELALQSGVTFFQLREKNLDTQAFIEEAKEIKKLCQKYQVPFIINDRVDIAKIVGADGVHVGQEDMDLTLARKELGPQAIIGVSCHSEEEALLAKENGADFLGVGAMFTTTTKKDTVAVSKETLREICQTTKLPVVAIGGVQKDNIQTLKDTGIAGVAVVSAIFGAKDISQACYELKQEVEKICHD